MKKELLAKIQALRTLITKLLDEDKSSLIEEQSADVEHMLSALKLVEKHATVLDTNLDTKLKRIRVLHDLTSPINGIIGYLFILEQEYSAPLTPYQFDLIKAIEVQTLQLYSYISQYLVTPHLDS